MAAVTCYSVGVIVTMVMLSFTLQSDGTRLRSRRNRWQGMSCMTGLLQFDVRTLMRNVCREKWSNMIFSCPTDI